MKYFVYKCLILIVSLFVLYHATVGYSIKKIEVGLPLIQGAKVEAELIKNGKHRTILIFKKRRRKNSRRKNGHRQQYSLIKINKIYSKDGSLISETKEKTKTTTKNEKKIVQKVSK